MFTSCNYLDVKPVGKVIPEKVTEFRALITSGYTAVSGYKYLLALRADEVIPSGSAYAYPRLIDFAIWNDNSVNMEESYPWGTPYKVIFYANSVIDDVMNLQFSEIFDYLSVQAVKEANTLDLKAFQEFISK